MHEALIANLATFLHKNDLVEKTISEHQPGRNGKCACCKTGKYAYTPWPCTTHKAAVHAARTFALSRRVG